MHLGERKSVQIGLELPCAGPWSSRLTYSILTPSYRGQLLTGHDALPAQRGSHSLTVRLLCAVPLTPLRLRLSSLQTLYQGHLWREVLPTCLMLALPPYLCVLSSLCIRSQPRTRHSQSPRSASRLHAQRRHSSWKVKSIQFGDTYLNLLYTRVFKKLVYLRKRLVVCSCTYFNLCCRSNFVCIQRGDNSRYDSVGVHVLIYFITFCCLNLGQERNPSDQAGFL